MSKNVGILRRKLIFREDFCPDRIINIVVDIRDFIGKPHNASLQCGRMATGPVIFDSIPDLFRKIETLTVFFQYFDHTHTLKIMGKSIRTKFIQDAFPGMTKWCMTKIVPQCNSLCQIFIQPERTGNSPCNLRNFQCVRQACPVMVSFWSQKYLGFMF